MRFGKSLVLALVSFASLAAPLAGTAHAQDGRTLHVVAASAPRPQNTVTFNPLALVFGIVQLEYERAVSPQLTIFGGPSMMAFNTIGVDGGSVFAAGLDVGARYFFREGAPRGLWIGPQANLSYASVDADGGESATAVAYSASLLFGHTWIARSGLTFSLAIGGGYNHFVADVGDDEVGFEGAMVAGRLALGYAF